MEPMLKEEFEVLAIRGTETISGLLYDTIERFYMSGNNYHRYHGGINETKQEFVNRVFGGKINTARTIALKTLQEAIKENTYCIGDHASKERLMEMNALMAEHMAFEAIGKCNSQYYVMRDYLKANIH